MNFAPDPADEEFRLRVRAFINEFCPEEARRVSTRPAPEKVKAWRDLLVTQKWLAPHWPVDWGGLDISPVRRYILQEELAATITSQMDGIALHLVAPVIYTFGSLKQKLRYLPKILSGEETWCQGFSEPESGSDVLSAKTTAERQGDYYTVTGEKIWTTGAHRADMMFALVRVRAAGRLQHGLSFVVFSMRDPAVRIRPITTIDGVHHFNQVSLNGVRVPTANLIGEEGKGWHYARFLLVNERALVAQAPNTRKTLRRLRAYLDGFDEDRVHSYELADFKERLTELEIEQDALEFMVMRVLHSTPGDPFNDGLAAALKIKGAQLRQRANELFFDAHGAQSLQNKTATSVSDDGQLSEPAKSFLFSLSGSIAGGTNEIQRNIIAGMVLGLT